MQSDAFRIRGPVVRPSQFVLFSAFAVIVTCVLLGAMWAEHYDPSYDDFVGFFVVSPLGLLSCAQGFAVIGRSKLAAGVAAVACFACCIPFAVLALDGKVSSLIPLTAFATGCAANITWARTLARWPPVRPRTEPPGFPVLPPRSQP